MHTYKSGRGASPMEKGVCLGAQSQTVTYVTKACQSVIYYHALSTCTHTYALHSMLGLDPYMRTCMCSLCLRACARSTCVHDLPGILGLDWHTVSHHHTYYVTSSHILLHIITHTMSHHHRYIRLRLTASSLDKSCNKTKDARYLWWCDIVCVMMWRRMCDDVT